MDKNLLHKDILNRSLKNRYYSFYTIAFQRKYHAPRYQDPKTSRWLSTDPALGEYIPGAPINDEVRKQNGNLPGMGGVFNTVNLHLYHYAGNNPVRYTDPDGKSDKIPQSHWASTSLQNIMDLVAVDGITNCNGFIPQFLKGLGDKVYNDIMPTGSPSANDLYNAWTNNKNLVNLNDWATTALGKDAPKGEIQAFAAEAANDLANRGYLVLAATSNTEGHVAVVAPQDTLFQMLPALEGFTGSGMTGHQGRSKPEVLRDYPVFNQSGTYTGTVPPGWAFDRDMFKDGQVKFFVYKPVED